MKHFVPLESNPEVFTELAHRLGLSANPVFRDVLTLDASQLPRLTYALILIFPTSGPYEEQKAFEEESARPYTGPADGVLWFKQTINNACGLYAILHAVCNGGARHHICRSQVR